MKPFRKKFLINSDFQLPFVTRIVIINLFVIGALYIGVYIIFYRFNLLGGQLDLDSTHKYYEFVQEQFIFVTSIFAGIAISSSIVLIVYSFFLSHRIAGPMENLKLKFKKLESVSPEVCKTKFRKDDFFHDVAEAYNLYIENESRKKHHSDSNKEKD